MSEQGVKVWIEKDEWYPVYSTEPEARHRKAVTIPFSRQVWINRVFDEFNEVQDYLESLVEAHD